MSSHAGDEDDDAGVDHVEDEEVGTDDESDFHMPSNNGMTEIIELLRRQELRDGDQTKHAFWATQPMPHDRFAALQSAAAKSSPSSAIASSSSASSKLHAPIEPNKPKEELRQTPYNMPPGFEWTDLNIMEEADRMAVYQLLRDNYVEDDSAMFRFDYSPEFLIWALTPPGFSQDFHLGVRSAKSKKLMGFISAVPAHIRVYGKVVPMVEINYLCVHKKLRSKRLAPVLIKEITRRVNHTGVFQAVYTAGLVLPVPVSTCRYYHRSLDPKKLIEVGFSRLAPRMTMARTVKLFKLPNEISTPNLRPMKAEDVEQAHKLLEEYLAKHQLVPKFSQEDFAHWLLPRAGVVSSFVAQNDPKDPSRITDLCSYYHLPSTVIGNPKHHTLFAAYSFYNVANTVPLKDLMQDAMIFAKRQHQDVFNALNLMDNQDVLQDLKFGIGDGRLQYYLYNWSCPTMEAKEIGLVLL